MSAVTDIARRMAQAAWDAGHLGFVSAGSQEAFETCAAAAIEAYRQAEEVWALSQQARADADQARAIKDILARIDAEGPTLELTALDMHRLSAAAADVIPF